MYTHSKVQSQHSMSDAFISYSRLNDDFAASIEAALLAADPPQTVWRDKSGLGPGVKWRPEVQEGIAAAHNFIFIITPESVRDTIPTTGTNLRPCGFEIEHAAALGMRIIPLMLEYTPSATLHPAVRECNYIDFRAHSNPDDSAAFNAAFARLLTALHTDTAWVHAHTRLQNRSSDWQTHNHDRSYLLTGADLTDAEHWLAQPADTHLGLRPTALEAEYIAASRASEMRSQKLRIRIAIAVATLSIVLAAFALVQRSTARTQARIATAGALAANAFNLKDTQLDLASLLALEASRLADTFDTRNALLTVSQSLPTLHAYIQGDPADGFTNSIAFTPDGAFYATGSDTGVLHLRDAATHRILFTYREPKGYVEQIAFSTGDTLAILNYSGVKLWKLSGPTLTPLPGDWPGVPNHHTSLAVSPDGAFLAIGGVTGIQVWSARTRQPVRSFPSATGTVWSIAFDPSNPALLASVTAGGKIAIRNVLTGADTSHLPPITPAPDGTTVIAFSKDGRYLAAGAGLASVGVWTVTPAGDLSSGRQTPLGDNGLIMGLAFSPDGETLAAASSHGVLRQWDVPSLSVIQEAPRNLTLDLHAVAFNPAGTLLISGLDDGALLVWDRYPAGIRTLSAPPSPQLDFNRNPMRNVAFSPDSHLVAGLDYYGGVTLWNLLTNIRAQVLPPQLRLPNLPSMSFTPDGRSLLISEGAFTRTWDIATQSFTNLSPGLQQNSLAAQSSTGLLAVAGPNGLSLTDLQHPDRTIPLPDTPPASSKVLSFSPDGKLLASAGDDESSVRLWDLSSATARRIPLEGPAQWCESLVFNSNGTLLAGTGFDGLALWNTKTGKRAGPHLQQNRKTIETATFSPDGERLAIAIYGGAVQLADAATLRFIGSPLQPDLQQEGDGPSGVAFSPDGKLLAYGGDNGHVFLWDADPQHWRTRACQLANRNLTPAEWTRYIGPTISYHRTCPNVP